jgi:hypothetical protein
MPVPTPDTPLVALRRLHDELWDPARGMVRMPAGVAPGVDVGHLHSIRETALGAFLDLEHGVTERAVAALRSVLALQYPLSPWPWSGTFPVTAEQPEPPGADAIEWVHYDPNWRQFIGCILALVRLHHGEALPDDVADGIATALVGCVHGEPPDRIPRWYTNPNLMHAWLSAHVGVATGDPSLVVSGEARLEVVAERFERYGDVDEYNSPTYDGIDLFALALWTASPPTDRFAAAGASMAERMGERISALYDPAFGTTCGPYIRSYGIDPRRYVSLFGLCALVAGEPADRVLPPALGDETVHVHDLFFLSVLERLGAELRRNLRFDPVTARRRRAQRFGAGVVAHHELRPSLAVGWEAGRRHDASLHQYVPFTAHAATAEGPIALGVMVPPETAWVDVHRVDDHRVDVHRVDDHRVDEPSDPGGPGPFEVHASGRADRVGIRVVTAPERARRDDAGLDHGPVRVTWLRPPAEVVERSTAAGHEVLVTWDDPADGPVARVDVTVNGPATG